MLVIRMQRTGRKGHAMFRMVVQNSRMTPTSGKVVAYVGSYDPHLKVANLDKEKISFYLGHGAQPSERVARLAKLEKIKLPKWVTLPKDKKASTRNADKLRKNKPKPEAALKVPEPEKTPEPSTQAAAEPEAAESKTDDKVKEPEAK